MHPTTLRALADQKMNEYRREAEAQRLISQARRPARVEPIAPTAPLARDPRPRILPRPMSASEADC